MLEGAATAHGPVQSDSAVEPPTQVVGEQSCTQVGLAGYATDAVQAEGYNETCPSQMDDSRVHTMDWTLANTAQ